MAGYLKGALVSFTQAFLIPLPNVILFQYNPETMTHTWTPATSAGGTGGTSATSGSNPLAVSGVPGESFSFTITMNSNETISDGSVVTAGLAELSGVSSRLAALELLQYPVPSDASASLNISASAGGLSIGGGASGGVTRSVPAMQVPTVLFVWGPGRIVPVRVASLTITEKLYDALLNPTHVEAQLSLKVLTPEELAAVTGPLQDIAKGAYVYSQGLRQALAIANLANATESVIGLLPV